MLYSASKASLVSIVQSAAPILKEINVFLNLINPSKTNTNMRKRVIPFENINDLLQPTEVASSILKLSLTNITGEIVDL